MLGEAANAVGRRQSLSNLWLELSSGYARQVPISPSMRWKTDLIADWNKWSSAERVLAVLVASLLLMAMPLNFFLVIR
jgi:hypothetical protein